MGAVGVDEIGAGASGVHVFRTKLLGFLVRAAMTALAGGLYMQFYQAIDPESAFGLGQAIQLQLPALIGGLGTASGPILGGALMIVLSEITNWAAAKLNLVGVDILVYGLVLLLVVLWAPKGIVGVLKKRGGRHD